MATQGYLTHKTDEFRMEAENFAKTAAKFEKKLGSQAVNLGHPDFWKQKCENFVEYAHHHEQLFIIKNPCACT